MKLLQKSYYGKVKMIYIDPPYNTGKDFIYKDKYGDNLEHYLDFSNQMKKGLKLSTNTESNGRFHSFWLNMLYPRLKLARNLLSDDGIIFISIDDNELSNLKKICDEIFGESNFLAQMIIDGTPKNDPYIVSTAHEYCLIYVKDFNKAKNSNFGLINPLYSEINNIFIKNGENYENTERELESFYKNNNLKKDNISNYKFVDKNGVFRIGPIDDPQNSGPKDERINPLTGTPCLIPKRGWSCNLKTWNEWIEQDLIFFPKDNNKIPSKKTYIKEGRLDVMKAYMKIQTRKDTDNLKKLFDTSITPFPNPKPKNLIKLFLENCNDKKFTVLDFFSGSGTVAEAVFDLNNEDFGKRNFILVQIPEEISEKNSLSSKDKKIKNAAINFLNSHNLDCNLCEIGKERIRRAGDKILEESENKDLDIGFKVFKLDSSNLEKWNPDYDNLEQSLLTHGDAIKDGRSNEDLVYELMLKYGIDLTVPVEEVELNDNKIYSIGLGSLIACLSNNITKELANDIVKYKEDLGSLNTRVIFKDTGFKSDSDKTNIKEILRTNNIEEFITI